MDIRNCDILLVDFCVFVYKAKFAGKPHLYCLAKVRNTPSSLTPPKIAAIFNL